MPYNGHRSWNAWNVSLWISNDEHLYREAVRLIKRYGKDKGSLHFYRMVEGTKTPDGAPYSRRSIREAFRGMS